MALLYVCGFEKNSITDAVEVSSNNATVAIVTTNPRSGTYHGRVSGSSNGFWRQPVFTSNQTTVGYIGVAICIHASVNANTQLIRWSNTSNANQCNITLKTDNTLVLLKANGTQIGSASAALTADTWYYVELQNDASGAGALDARLNGTSFAAGANSAAGTWARALIGLVTGAQTTADVYFDDWVINDSTTGGVFNTWSGGAGGVNKLAYTAPNGNGETTQWTIAGSAAAATNWQGVNEITPDDATTLNNESILNKEDLYTVTSVGRFSYDTINAVLVGMRYNNDVADATTAYKVEIEKASGGTKTLSASIVPNSTTWRSLCNASPDVYPLVTYTDPDAAAWTNTTLDSMRIGMIAGLVGVNKIQVSNIWAYVHYTPGTAPATGTFSNLALMGVG